MAVYDQHGHTANMRVANQLTISSHSKTVAIQTQVHWFGWLQGLLKALEMYEWELNAERASGPTSPVLCARDGSYGEEVASRLVYLEPHRVWLLFVWFRTKMASGNRLYLIASCQIRPEPKRSKRPPPKWANSLSCNSKPQLTIYLSQKQAMRMCNHGDYCLVFNH